MIRLAAALSTATALFLLVPHGTPTVRGSDCDPATQPILSIEPPAAEPWSSAFIYTCNGFVPNEIAFGGVPGLVINAESQPITVAVPIAAPVGRVDVTIGGAFPSYPYNIIPISHADSSAFTVGTVVVTIPREVLIDDIVATIGPSAGSVRDGEPFCFGDQCHYIIDVSPGTEVSTSIAYFSHPDVIWASPEGVGCPLSHRSCQSAVSPSPVMTASPTTAIVEPTVTPGSLPRAGERPLRSKAGSDWAGPLVLVSLLAASASFVLSRRR